MEYRHPKLSATAVLRDESSFAKALERAIERSANGAGNVPQIIDAKAE
jgi:hypothetical protein